MTEKQFDIIVTKLVRLEESVENLSMQIYAQAKELELLNSKTVTVSDVGNEIVKLKLDIQSLKDEKEA